MPIPQLNASLVLPPHLGNPTASTEVSPYRATTLELCEQFASTPERVTILQGLLRFRERLQTAGMKKGFQLLDGSFLEDIEALEGRPPRDLDIVTFFWQFDSNQQNGLVQGVPELSDLSRMKAVYHLDHYLVDAGFHPDFTVQVSQYWYGLFSHRRDGLWKGMLRIELDTPNEDALASALLAQRSAPVGVQP